MGETGTQAESVEEPYIRFQGQCLMWTVSTSSTTGMMTTKTLTCTKTCDTMKIPPSSLLPPPHTAALSSD